MSDPVVVIARLTQHQWGRKLWITDARCFMRACDSPTHWQPIPAVGTVKGKATRWILVSEQEPPIRERVLAYRDVANTEVVTP